LNYAPRSWGNTYKSKLTKISTKQNRCIWCIFFVDSRENANLHYNILGVLKLENIIKLKTEIFASKFSVHDPNVPVAFSDFLNPVHLVYKGPVIISKMGGGGGWENHIFGVCTFGSRLLNSCTKICSPPLNWCWKLWPTLSERRKIHAFYFSVAK
jgi:hypothetical protein